MVEDGGQIGSESARAGSEQPDPEIQPVRGAGLSVASRFGVVVSVVLGLFLAAGVVTVSVFFLIVQNYNDSIGTVRDQAIPLLELKEEVFILSELHAWDTVISVTGGETVTARGSYDGQVGVVDAKFAAYLSNRTDASTKELKYVEAAREDWISARDTHVMILGHSELTQEQMAEQMNAMSARFDGVTAQLRNAYDVTNREVSDIEDNVSSAETLAAWVLGGMFLLGLAMVALTARSLSRFMVQPIRRLQEATRRVRKGELSHRVLPSGPAELTELGVAFNEMAKSVARANGDLEYRALHDDLTGLANRVLLRDRIDHARSMSGRVSDPYALLVIDLDRFKNVNDTLGHSFGDEVLAEAANRIRDAVRGMDTVARLGGDEFAVFVEHISGVEQVVEVAERINESLSRPFQLGDDQVVLGASTGISLSSGIHDSETLLRDADLAMYAAKATGGSSYEIFQPLMQLRLTDSVVLEHELRIAIERHEIELQYQPIFNLATGRLAGLEALARWTHSDRGAVWPERFIPIAERSGLIVTLGSQLLDTACDQASSWIENHGEYDPFFLAVNISVRQFEEDNFTDLIEDTLERSGLAPANLMLEITESMLLRPTEDVRSKLQVMADLGVRVALDDFGVGYSSLSSLHRLPIDILKLDRSFIDDVDDPTVGNTVIKTIIDGAHSLGAEPIAEGIERHAQLRALTEMGCTYGQGFLLHRPAPFSVIDEFLNEGASMLSVDAIVTIE